MAFFFIVSKFRNKLECYLLSPSELSITFVFRVKSISQENGLYYNEYVPLYICMELTVNIYVSRSATPGYIFKCIGC